ncbi:TPA: zinc ribbon domain-containing protein [Escherichia coli]|nr:zinc ribbon domain-containing protein [Escherichia coli]
MELVIICALLGCIPAMIAKRKGRDFWGWWLYGALLFIIALIHSLVIKKDIRAIERSQLNEGLVKCPFCAEMIKPEAIKCKHCGSDIEPQKKRNNLLQITGFVVTMTVNDNIQLDDFKIKELAERIKNASDYKDSVELLRDYRPQLEVIEKTIPEELRGEFRDRVIYWIS